MNNEGFIGIITDDVKKTVERIYELGINTIVKGMSKEAIDFFTDLKYTWCSPKAIKFYSEHAAPLVNTINYISDEIINICKKVEEAHNIMSTSNDSDLVIVDMPNYKLLSLPQLLDNLNEIRGMNVTKVKNRTRQFKELMKISIGKLEDLPIRISLFDPGRDLAITYRHMLDEMKEKATTEIDAIVEKITKDAETEVDQVILTKEYAESVLSNQ